MEAKEAKKAKKAAEKAKKAAQKAKKAEEKAKRKKYHHVKNGAFLLRSLTHQTAMQASHKEV